MNKTPRSFWRQLNELLVPSRQPEAAQTVTNERMLHELIHCFEASLQRESIGNSLLFDAHYVVVLHPDSYAARLAALPVVVNEAVNAFYERIDRRRKPQDRIVTVASHWHFKFGPGTELNGEIIGPSDVAVIGSLTGASLETAQPAGPEPNRNLKATRKIKNTNVYQQMDLNRPEFSHIDFRESGAFAVRIDAARLNPSPSAAASPVPAPVAPVAPPPRSNPAQGLARIDCYVADQNTEATYWMNDREIVIARQEPDNEAFANYIRLASPYVSNPHARIRYNAGANRFELASFSRHETRLNEQVVARSEPGNPVWVPLPSPAQILLNGVVTLTFQQTNPAL